MIPVIGLVLMSGAVCGADVWYVATNGVDAVGRGTESLPFHSLQYAHDAAAAGDTVYVKPGVYDYGEKVSQWSATANITHTNRLVVSKKLFFRATGSVAETHIVGAHDSTATGCGPAGIRCILVTTDGADSEFHGFTLRDGAADDSGAHSYGDGSEGYAGGFGVMGTINTTPSKTMAGYKAFLVDCVISNCVAKFGGGVRGGTSIRCLYKNNGGTSWGQTAVGAALWNCVVTGNDSFQTDRPAIGNGVRAVNTTIVGSTGCGFMQSGIAYNSVFSAISGNETNKTYAVSACPNTYWKADDAYPLVAPALEDYRLVSGTPAENGGKMAYLTDMITLPADTEMTDFLGNPIDTASSTCHAGAVQGAAVAVTGGALTVPARTLVDGRCYSKASSYIHATNYPAVYTYRPETANFLRYWMTGDIAQSSSFRYLTYSGEALFMPPCGQNDALIVQEVTCSNVVWCDPAASAEEATGSFEKPFRTLQAAVDYVNAKWPGSASIVKARPGDYREGSRFANSHTNRLVIPSGCPVFIKSTGGAAVTTIWGEADPNAPEDEGYPGCGPCAMRCVSVLGSTDCNAAMQGFTLANGHSGNTRLTTDEDGDRVGGVYAKSEWKNFQLIDSVVTNCSAIRGGAAYYGRFVRCAFYDCVSYGGVFRYAHLCESYVDPTCRLGAGRAGAARNTVLGTGTVTSFCTVPSGDVTSSSSFFATVFDALTYAKTSLFDGSVCRTMNGTAEVGQGPVVVADLQFVDTTAHDYRLATLSHLDARVAPSLPAKGTSAWHVLCTNVMSTVDFALDGVRPQVADGRLLPGCYQQTVDGVTLAEATCGGVRYDGAKAGFNPLTDDFSLTVSQTASGTRPCIGFTVDGVTNRFDDAPSVSYDASDVRAAGGGFTVKPIYTSDWYVNPGAEYADTNTGFTPKTARRTLKGAVEAAGLASGDTIHAAAGTYDSGQMTITNDTGRGTHAARVIVPEGVTLKGAGVGKSFIVGQKDGTGDHGIGPDAVKCVYMMPPSNLAGFTLTGGYTGNYDSTLYANEYSPDFSGGGVCSFNGSGRDKAYVSDCLISNCWAYTAGGARWCSLVRCRLFENHALVGGGAGRELNLYGCVVNRSYSGTKASHGSIYNFTKLYSSTFGPDNWTLDGQTANLALQDGSSKVALIENCLILGAVNSPGSMTSLVTNSVFRGSKGSYKLDATSRVATEAETAVDADLRPIVGANVAIDAANESIVPAVLDTDSDLTGAQRVYNGRMDIGALEADWRPTYARLLGGRRVTVTRADPNVVAEGRTVRIGSGTLSLSWTDRYEPQAESLVGTLRVTGDGTLTVGEETYSAADGTVEKAWSSVAGANELTFSYAPGAPDAGAAELSSFRLNAGMVIIFR